MTSKRITSEDMCILSNIRSHSWSVNTSLQRGFMYIHVKILILYGNNGFYFQGSIRVANYDNFGVERDQTPFMDQETDDIRGGNANG